MQIPTMITGFVDRHWARHHYRLWYDEHFDATVCPLSGIGLVVGDRHRRTVALGGEPVGRDDHFFALGGHSLLAARVALTELRVDGGATASDLKRLAGIA